MSKTIAAQQASTGSYIWIIVRLSVLFIVLCGIVYPLLCTGIAQLVMPDKANGSLLTNSNHEVIGSELIGQNFIDPKYFQGRVSSIENNAASSGSNNYAPSNPAMIERTKQSVEAWKTANPDVPIEQLPLSLITNSGSGLDPHITPESAMVQIPRISKLTGIPAAQLEILVKEKIEGRDLGLFGEPRVNVLLINVELASLLKK